MIGRTVGQYEILEKIGEGGMGEVWLARDTTLGRQVALKFLRAELQTDEIARQRLVREARAVAALNQPFICGIHAVGEEEGSTYLAMEYVEGQTLQQRLLTGPLPLREALRLGVEIAEALDKAHQKGIIHRDLKPSNIMITTEGHAKVMDFGLAKTIAGAGGLEEHIHSLSLTLTDQEMLVGTISYMSPEQIRAQDLDHRSDIFSFGLLLYEMMTGQHPFRADSPLDTAVAIIDRDCPPLPAELSETVPELQSFLEQLLAKHADQRPDSLQQVKATLSQLLEETTSVTGLPISRTRPRKWFAAISAIALVVAVSAVIAIVLGRSAPTSSPGFLVDERNFQMDPHVLEVNPSWSPLGDEIVYDSENNGATDIYVANVETTESRSLTADNEDDDFGPVWSPDGAHIAFYSIRNGRLGLYTMTARALDVQRIADVNGAVRWPASISWRQPGFLVFPNPNENDEWDIYRIDKKGERPAENLTESIAEGLSSCDISRSGRYLLCGTHMNAENRPLYLVDTRTGVAESLSCSGLNPRWGPDDRYLHFCQWDGENTANLYCVAVDTLQMGTTGEVIRRSSGYYMTGFSFSPDADRMVCMISPDSGNDLYVFPESELITDPIRNTWRTRLPIFLEAASFLPDGSGCLTINDRWPLSRMIIQISIDSANRYVPLGNHTTSARLPLACPRGNWVIASHWSESMPRQFPYLIQRGGENWRPLDSTLTDTYHELVARDWSSDGTRIAFNARVDEQEQIWHIGWIEFDPESGRSGAVHELEITGSLPHWSPDDRFLAYSAGIDTISTVWIANHDGTNARIIVPPSWLETRFAEHPTTDLNAYVLGWSHETGRVYFEFQQDVWRIPLDRNGNPLGPPELWMDLPPHYLVRGYRLDFRGGNVLVNIGHMSSDLVILQTEDRQ